MMQPVYTFALHAGSIQIKTGGQQAGDPNSPNADAGDPAQYIVKKFHLAEAHRITKGDNVVIAVIDSEIDFNQPNLAGAIALTVTTTPWRYRRGPHGTGMAGYRCPHGRVGVAPLRQHYRDLRLRWFRANRTRTQLRSSMASITRSSMAWIVNMIPPGRAIRRFRRRCKSPQRDPADRRRR